jgi:hypothetical protein
MLDKNIPVKYMFSFKRAVGARSGVQPASYAMNGRFDLSLADLIDRNAVRIYTGAGRKDAADVEPVITEHRVGYTALGP